MRERGAIIKQQGKNLHTGVIFPAPYNLAMSSLAYQSIYSFLNGLNGVLCDRFVWGKDRSIEHDLSYQDYKVAFITAPFILDIPKVLMLCHKALSHKEYTRAVCIGGIAAVANKDLFYNSDAIIFSGPFESHAEHIKRILNLVKAGANRDEIKGEMQPVVIKEETSLQKSRVIEYDPPASVIYTKDTEFSNMHLVEITRGCTGNCNFCMSKHLIKYYSEFKYENIIRAIDKAPEEIKTVGLIGDAVLSHSRIADIVDYILQRRKRPSFSSIRIADLSPKKIPLILKSDIKTLTIAPEVATESLMKITNKYYNQSLLFEILKELVKGGVMNIKLYMMIGLPNETLNDINDMLDFIQKIRDILITASRGKGRVGTLRLSINNFVPSPFTPLADENPDSMENLEYKQSLIKRRLLNLPNLSLTMMDIFDTIFQTALFRADSAFAHKIVNFTEINYKKLFYENTEFANDILRLAYRKR